MKPFTTDDLFKAMRLLKHSGIKEKVKDLLSGIADGEEVDLERIGLDAIMEAVYAFAEEGCQRELYDLLSGPWEMSAEEIGKLPLSELCGKLEETAKSEDLRDFFTQLAELISMKP
jgi:hypothetical protein